MNSGDSNSQPDGEFIPPVLQYAPLAILRVQEDWSCVFANDKWCEISGKSVADSLGQGWLESIPIEERAALESVVENAIRSSQPRVMSSLRISHPLAGARSYTITVCPDSTGKAPAGFTCFCMPREEKSGGADEKRKTRDFHPLISSLEDIVLEIDYNKIFKNVWTGNEDLLFMPKAQFLNKSMAEVFGAMAPLFLEPIDEVIRTSEPKEFVYQDISGRSDKWYKARVSPVHGQDGDEEQTLVVVVQDCTETRKYLEALENIKNELERGKRLLDIGEELSLTSGWEFDRTTSDISLTRQAYKIYELEEDDIITITTVHRYYDDRNWELLNKASLNALATGTTFDIELKLLTAKNSEKWVRVIGTPVLKENKVTGLAGAMMDISHKKIIEKELINARILAENAASEKANFLSVMSHEIRTPLNNIIGLANLLKMDHAPGNEEYINNLVFSSNHLLQLINDILNLHKIEEGKLDRHLEKLSLASLADNIKNQFIPFANEKKITLKSETDPAIPHWVMANPTLLIQILNNLIGNAIKFTDRGTVTISISLREMRERIVVVHFSVRDTGIGIPFELQQTIFESFRQLRQSASGKYPSTGLGLTITKRLIESQGSQINVESMPGSGTEFYFDLPFKQVVPGEEQEMPPGVSLVNYKGKLSSLRLLVVEDNPINLVVTKNQLDYFGITPDCATQGKEALAFLESNTYHIVVLDLHLPDMDGYTLAGIIRERYPETRILIFTADTLADVRKKVAGLQRTDLLKKPFLPEEMLTQLLQLSVSDGSPSA